MQAAVQDAEAEKNAMMETVKDHVTMSKTDARHSIATFAGQYMALTLLVLGPPR